ncbi:MAG: mechanosensitive ion channel family protein, partial [Chthoniobacteraceae bacterium]
GVAGVAGIAIGFAFRDIVENYLAGILLSLRQPFRIGDHLWLENHEGKVVRLTSREMVLITLDGNHLRIPNGTVFKSIICNYSLNPRRRFEFMVGIGVNEDIVHAQEVGIATLHGISAVLKDPPALARVDGLGDSSVSLRYLAWVDQKAADFYKVRSEGIRLVKTALDEAGIEMPEPIQRVHVRQIPEQLETASPRPIARKTGERDVSVTREIDHQIAEELAQSGEENLLQSVTTTERKGPVRIAERAD